MSAPDTRTSTRMMATVGEQYRASGLAERDALVGGLPVMRSRGIRLVDAAAVAIIVAACLLLVGEHVGWLTPALDILFGVVAGAAKWFVTPLLRSRR